MCHSCRSSGEEAKSLMFTEIQTEGMCNIKTSLQRLTGQKTVILNYVSLAATSLFKNDLEP